MPRSFSYGLVGILLWLLVTAANAVGLGAVIGEPGIGAPLNVEIPLSDAIDTLASNCFRVVRPIEATDSENFPVGATARTIKRNGELAIRVSTERVIRTPIVEFRIEVGCGHNLSREYVLLTSLAPEQAAARPISPAKEPVSLQSTEPVRPIATVANSREAGSLPDRMAAKSHVIERTMPLSALANHYFPGQPKRSERFMRWVVEANPAQFSHADRLRDHQLQQGAAVLVPIGIPPRRPGDHPGEKTRLPFLDTPLVRSSETSEPEGASALRKVPSPSIRARRETNYVNGQGKADRLLVSGDVINASLLNPKNPKHFSLLADRLGDLEGATAQDRDQLNVRIDRLENLLVQFSDYAVKLETQAKEREAQIIAEREAAQLSNSRQQLVQIAIALIAGALIGALLFALIRKKREPELAAMPAPIVHNKNDHETDNTPPRVAVVDTADSAPQPASPRTEPLESLNFASRTGRFTVLSPEPSVAPPAQSSIEMPGADRTHWEYTAKKDDAAPIDFTLDLPAAADNQKTPKPEER